MRSLALLTAALLCSTAEARNWKNSYEYQANATAACNKAGEMAVMARNTPEGAKDLIADSRRKRTMIGTAFADAMQRGIESDPNASVDDVHRRGWAACMDVLNR